MLVSEFREPECYEEAEMWIDILLVVLTVAFAGVAIYRGIKHRKEGIVPFIIASIILGSLLALPVETIEFLGTKIAIRGPRLRDVSIEIKSLGSQLKPEDLSVFLVPAPNKGTISASEPTAKFDFEAVPEGFYHVLVKDSAGHHSLLENKSVAGANLELDPIPRFPEEASLSGVVRRFGSRSASGTIVVAGDELARVDQNGRFELIGLQHGGSYDLEVFGDDIASREVNVSSYEEQLATAIYAPDPVPLARICEEMEIRSSEDESEQDAWSCLDRDFDRYPADVDTLWFYTRIQAAPPTVVVHRWRYGSDEVDVTLQIESRDFRTRSSRQIAGRVGQWTVEVLSADKATVLLSKSFEVGAD